jgi:GNAT superfamily N-acetyltransferase
VKVEGATVDGQPTSQPPMKITPASPGASAACERILRGLPAWFGIESSILKYAADSKGHPTLLARQGPAVVGFVTVRQHFQQSFEIHCLAVQASLHHNGIGAALLQAAESWCRSQAPRSCKSRPSRPVTPAQNMGKPEPSTSVQVMFRLRVPLLWSQSNPCCSSSRPCDAGGRLSRQSLAGR